MDTSTGLFGVVPAFAFSRTSHSTEPFVYEALNLLASAPEVNRSLLVLNPEEALPDLDKSQEVYCVQAKGRDYYETILRAVEDYERKEGENVRLILTLHPSNRVFLTENIMECFQRIIIDVLSDGIVSMENFEMKMNGDGYLDSYNQDHHPALAIWKRDALSKLMTRESRLNIIPYL